MAVIIHMFLLSLSLDVSLILTYIHYTYIHTVDDMVDTAGTLCKAVDVLLEQGARRVFAFCSHGVLSGPAASRIKSSQLTELVILDTIPLSKECMVSTVVVVVVSEQYFYIMNIL